MSDSYQHAEEEEKILISLDAAYKREYELEFKLARAEELLAQASFINECKTIECKSCLEHLSLIQTYFKDKT